ncbi:hypothetical protein [Nannocystis pusilla]|uniref:hypothetical protein n=1 Tax=Nannocystis pusilla TaxID=889268 RepID=UPI003DA4E8E2
MKAVDADGRTLLHEAARKIILRDVDVAVIELLLAAGADPTARDRHGMTAHGWAVELLARSQLPAPQPTPRQAQVLAALQQGAAG